MSSLHRCNHHNNKRPIHLTTTALLVLGWTCVVQVAHSNLHLPSFINPFVHHDEVGFKWSMPPKFGRDDDGDGLVDYVPLNEWESASVPRLTVLFECDPQTIDLMVDDEAGKTSTVEWRIDGKRVDLYQHLQVPENMGTDYATATTCGGYHDFPKQERYNVELIVDGKSHRDVVYPRDFLIVGIGDAYGSGEGNPEVPIVHDEAIDLAIQSLETLKQLENDLSTLNEEGCDIMKVFQCVEETFRAPSSGGDDTEEEEEEECQCLRRVASSLAKDSLEILTETKQAVEYVQAAWKGDINSTMANWTKRGDVDGETTSSWQPEFTDERMFCHRSARSAQALAAKLIEDDDDKSTVTFVHASCSGATMEDIREGQLDFVRRVVGSREVDAVLVSASPIDPLQLVLACMIQQDCTSTSMMNLVSLLDETILHTLCGVSHDVVGGGVTAIIPELAQHCHHVFVQNWPQDSAGTILSKNMLTFQEARDGVRDALEGKDGTRPFVRDDQPDRIVFVEFDSPFHSETGDLCYGSIPGVDQSELDWLDTKLTKDIPQVIAGTVAATARSQHVVGPVQNKKPTHGICAEPHEERHFFNMAESFLVQGDHFGFLRPNLAGHEAMAQRLANELKGALYNKHKKVPRAATSPPKVSDLRGPQELPLGDIGTYTITASDADGDDIELTWVVIGSARSCVIEAKEYDTLLLRALDVDGTCIVRVVGSDRYSGNGDAVELVVQVGKGAVMLPLTTSTGTVTETVPTVSVPTTTQGINDTTKAANTSAHSGTVKDMADSVDGTDSTTSPPLNRAPPMPPGVVSSAEINGHSGQSAYDEEGGETNTIGAREDANADGDAVDSNNTSLISTFETATDTLKGQPIYLLFMIPIVVLPFAAYFLIQWPTRRRRGVIRLPSDERMERGCVPSMDNSLEDSDRPHIVDPTQTDLKHMRKELVDSNDDDSPSEIKNVAETVGAEYVLETGEPLDLWECANSDQGSSGS